MLIIKTNKKHLEMFNPIDIQLKEYLDLFCMEPDVSFTVIVDSEPVLIFGLYNNRPNVYYAFTVFSAGWKPKYYKHIIKWSKLFFEKFSFERIEHLISCDRPWAHKMIKLFGFTCEGILRKYSEGKDYYMYAVVK